MNMRKKHLDILNLQREIHKRRSKILDSLGSPICKDNKDPLQKLIVKPQQIGEKDLESF